MKEDVVAAGVKAVQDAEVQALSDQLGIAYDAGKADGGGLSQADVDAAVAAQQAADAQVLADAQAKADADLAAAKQALADMTAKEQLEEAAVADVKAKIDAVQASFDAIKALFSPPPAPPVGDPSSPSQP